jgi:hypothetical protein
VELDCSSLDDSKLVVVESLLLLYEGNLGILVVVFLAAIRLEGIDCYFGCFDYCCYFPDMVVGKRKYMGSTNTLHKPFCNCMSWNMIDCNQLENLHLSSNYNVEQLVEVVPCHFPLQNISCD